MAFFSASKPSHDQRRKVAQRVGFAVLPSSKPSVARGSGSRNRNPKREEIREKGRLLSHGLLCFECVFLATMPNTVESVPSSTSKRSAGSAALAPAAFSKRHCATKVGGDKFCQQQQVVVPAARTVEHEYGSIHEPIKACPAKIYPSGLHLDLIGKIATFVDTGQDLTNLLVALGSAQSQKIRHEYLRNNEAYLVKSLHICRRAMAPAIMSNQPNSSNVLSLYHLSAKLFCKCRDNVMAWMEINTDWRSRCTVANMKRYRRTYMEANLIFNNFVVAIEVGLVEVFEHLVNEMEADVCDTDRKGFVADVASSHRGMDNFVFNPIIVALYRNDTKILRMLLESKTFRTESSSDARRILSDWEILNYCCTQNKIRMDAFEILVSSPKIDVNAMFRGYHCLHIVVLDLYRLIIRLRHRDDGSVEFMFRRLSALLDAGSNPHTRSYGDPTFADSAFKLAVSAGSTLKRKKSDSNLSAWRSTFWDRLLEKIYERK